jgi:hypothetical protein
MPIASWRRAWTPQRRRRIPVFAAASSIMVLELTALAVPQPAAQDPDISVSGVVQAAAAYVSTYQEQLNFLVADEIYTQQIRTQIPDAGTSKGRTMKSEMFFMFTPADRGWMAIRDVIEVDRKPVSGRQNLKSALETLPAQQVAGVFKAFNSRFNLGRIQRNFNEPILSLLVLDARHLPNVTFVRRRVERRAGVTLVTLAFHENAAPTLIRDLKLQSVISRGELTIEASTGRVRQADLRLSIGGVAITLTTIYKADDRLGLWVPAIFRETYEEGMRMPGGGRTRAESSDTREEIACEARYSNFRRFEVTARIKQPH